MLDCGIGKIKVLVPESYNFVFDAGFNAATLPSISIFTVLFTVIVVVGVATFEKLSTSLIPKFKL